jgi:hypothetical protein
LETEATHSQNELRRRRAVRLLAKFDVATDARIDAAFRALNVHSVKRNESGISAEKARLFNYATQKPELMQAYLGKDPKLRFFNPRNDDVAQTELALHGHVNRVLEGSRNRDQGNRGVHR